MNFILKTTVLRFNVSENIFRWSDFHVREISKDGEIARLTDLVSVPEKPKAKPLAVEYENYKFSDEDEIQIIRVKSNEGKNFFSKSKSRSKF